MSEEKINIDELSPEELVELANKGIDLSSGEKLKNVPLPTPVPPASDGVQCSTSDVGVNSDLSPEDGDGLGGVDIKDPVELLYLLDDKIGNGSIVLHDWQIQFMLDFADRRHTKDSPFQAEVLACNGSGKDKYVTTV